jgi:hypothetical protein
VNYKPVVGWWFYGGGSATETANYFGSWGLLGDAPSATGFNIWVLVSGAWKKVSAISVLVGGAWKAVSSLKVLVSNAWK